jgi:hypothetical protein
MRLQLSFTAMLATVGSLVDAAPAKYVSVSHVGILSLTAISDIHKRRVSFNWGSNDKIRGVSLGGWLVLES